MPEIKTVSVTYGRKLNLGDFNSATIDCTVWADVKENEDLDKAMKDLWQMAKENVKAQAMPLANKNPSMNLKEMFLGLPVTTEKES